LNKQGKEEKEKRKWPTASLLCAAIMLSGQLAINQGAEPSGSLIASGKKVVAKVERSSEREEVQGAYTLRRKYLSYALFTPDYSARFSPRFIH